MTKTLDQRRPFDLQMEVQEGTREAVRGQILVRICGPSVECAKHTQIEEQMLENPKLHNDLGVSLQTFLEDANVAPPPPPPLSEVFGHRGEGREGVENNGWI